MALEEDMSVEELFKVVKPRRRRTKPLAEEGSTPAAAETGPVVKAPSRSTTKTQGKADS